MIDIKSGLFFITTIRIGRKKDDIHYLHLFFFYVIETFLILFFVNYASFLIYTIIIQISFTSLNSYPVRDAHYSNTKNIIKKTQFNLPMGACCFVMKILFVFYFITVHFSRVQSAHFSGGSVTWKPLNTTGTIGSTINVMFTQSYQWKRSISSSFCDDTYIANRFPLVPSAAGSLACVTGTISQCGGYTSISIRGYCIDYSIPMDSSSTQISTIKSLTVGSNFCVAFRSTYWVPLHVNCPTTANPSSSTTATPVCYDSSAPWSIGTCVDLSIRSDGFINSPPVATVMSRM